MGLEFRFENIEIGGRPELLFDGWRRKDQVHFAMNISVMFDCGLHMTEEAFLLPTQQPQVRIPAPPRFFSSVF